MKASARKSARIGKPHFPMSSLALFPSSGPSPTSPVNFSPLVFPLPINQTQSNANLARSIPLSSLGVIRSYIDHQWLTQAIASHHAYAVR